MRGSFFPAKKMAKNQAAHFIDQNQYKKIPKPESKPKDNTQLRAKMRSVSRYRGVNGTELRSNGSDKIKSISKNCEAGDLTDCCQMGIQSDPSNQTFGLA